MEKVQILEEAVRFNSRGDWLNAPTIQQLSEWLDLTVDQVLTMVTEHENLDIIAGFETEDGLMEFDKENYIVVHVENEG